MGKAQRVYWLDAAKGFTALLVVMGHITNGYLTANHFQQWRWLIEDVHYLLYAFHMPLFMILSGYAFHLAYCVNREEKKKRYHLQLLNIALLYFIFAAIKWGMQTLLADYVAIPVTLNDLLCMWFAPLEELWYLYVLFFLYIIGYAIEKMSIREHAKLAAVFMIGSVSVCADWACRFPVDRILYYLPFFYLGVYLSKCPETKVSRGYMLYTVGTAAAGVCIVRTGDIRDIPLLGIGAALMMSLLVVSIFILNDTSVIRGKLLMKKLRLLGLYSLEIYVMHSYVIAAGRAFLPKMGITSLFANVPIIFVLAVLLPLAGAWVLKRIGLHAWFFRPAYTVCGRRNRKV